MFIRIFMCLLVSFFLGVSACSAMHFSQPVELGSIGGNPGGGFSIEGASYNKGTLYKDQFKGMWGTLYEKGTACYGEREKALWVYYDCSPPRGKDYREKYAPFFGDKKGVVGVNLMAGEGDIVKISSIKNDGGITLFFVAHKGCVVGAEHYVVMGYNREGEFVKYIEIREIVEKYLGKGNVGFKGVYLGKYYSNANIIIVEYVDPRISRDYRTPVGEFRFKWDEKAQWFGVEHVLY